MMLGACVALAQGPNNSGTYYRPADGKSGKSLKTAMAEVIVDHSAISYSGLWKCFYTTDRRSDGKVWDMYSSATNYTMGGPQQGANYKKEGDSYNREHSMPKSWFNDARPMYTDLVHIVPTDGYVNNRRGNYPFGETNGEQYQSAGGFSKLGRSTTSGYSGTVFEPADEYKGDFARIYFYMVTCYEKRVATWQSDMLDGTAYPALSRWALDLLLRWAKEDPVGLQLRPLRQRRPVGHHRGHRRPAGYGVRLYHRGHNGAPRRRQGRRPAGPSKGNIHNKQRQQGRHGEINSQVRPHEAPPTTGANTRQQ